MAYKAALESGERMAGELTPQEYQEILQLITAKAGPVGDCAVCGRAGTVSLAAHLVTPIATAPQGGIHLQAANYPQAMIMCNNCGNTRYFNYVLLKQNV